MDLAAGMPEQGFDWRALAAPAAVERLGGALNALAEGLALEPHVLEQLGTIIVVADDSSTSIKRLAELIEQHDFLAKDVMRVGNSAAYARGGRGTDVRSAVVKIGRERVRVLALEAAAYRLIDQLPRRLTAQYPDLHRRAMAVAATAGAAAKLVGADLATAALAGLLHDIGVVVLNLAAEDGAGPGQPVEGVDGYARIVAERSAWGVDHALAGGLLAARWGLSAGVATAIAWHHGGPSGLGSPTPEAACVQIAGQVSRSLSGEEPDYALLEVALRSADLDAEALAPLAGHAATLTAGRAPAVDLPRRMALLSASLYSEADGGLVSRERWLLATRHHLAEHRDEDGVLLVCDIARSDAEDGSRAPSEVTVQHAAALLATRGRPGRLSDRHLAVWLPGVTAAELPGLLSEWREEWSALCSGRPVDLRFSPVVAAEHGHDLAGLLDAGLARLTAVPAPAPAPAAPPRPSHSLYRAG